MNRILTREDRLQYVKRLRKMGVHSIGHGFNSHVFQHPTIENIAVKVVDASDKVYLQFLAWARRNQHNPFVPKVYDAVRVDCINNRGYVIVFLELLTEINTTEYNEFLDEIECPEGLSSDSIEDTRDVVQSDELRTLLNFLASKPQLLDLHEENFMKRGQQTVFIDPFAGNA